MEILKGNRSVSAANLGGECCLLILRLYIETLKSLACDGKVLPGVAIGQTALMSNAN